MIMLPDVLVPTYVQMLGALSAWLGKAEVQMPDRAAEALLVARLAPDMFPLSTRFASRACRRRKACFGCGAKLSRPRWRSC